jgi:hypothetical protein
MSIFSSSPFGKPDEGIHKYRDPIFNTAIVDVIFTIIGAFIISKYTDYSFIIILIILFILGIILHRLFCVRTTVDKFLFPYIEDSKFLD